MADDEDRTAVEERDDSGDYEDYDEGQGDPDVLLDVPNLSVEEITLEVEDLRARVSLQAEVLELLKLNVGADVELGRVSLKITGVQAEALLKVRLDRVSQIIERVLTTIDRNPQILEQVVRSAGRAVEELGAGGGKAVGEVGRGAGDAVGDVGKGAGEAVGEVGRGAGDAVGEVGAVPGTRSVRSARAPVRRSVRWARCRGRGR
ncbi:hypothetical protein ACFSVJ_20730 [Prauserella oleivorans]